MELYGIELTPMEEAIHSPKNIKTFENLMSELEKCTPKTLSELKDNNKIYLHLTTEEILDFIEAKGLYILIDPDFYTTGVNWNWQIYWYIPKEKWEHIPVLELREYDFTEGTFGYGDNGDYTTMNSALYSAIEMAFRIIETKQI